jgi:hypothetical protein
MVNKIPNYLYSGSLGVGRDVANDANIYLQIGPNGAGTKGVLLPRVADTASITGTKRNGLLIYSNQLGAFAYFDSTSVVWRKLGFTDTTVISTKANTQKVVNDTAAVLRTLVGSVNTRISGLQAANGTNTIDNTNYLQTWNWSTLTGSGLLLGSTSTAGTSNGYVLGITRSGANASGSITSKGLDVSISNTGTSSTNYGGYFVASGGTLYNRGIYGEGSTYGVGGYSSSTNGTGVSGAASGSGGIGVSGTATGSGTNYAFTGTAVAGTTNFGIQLGATGGTNAYAAHHTASSATNNYAGWYSASGGSNNYALFTESGKILFKDLISSGAKFVKTNALGQLYASDTLSASGAPISGLTAATATNTINNADYAQEWQWNTLTTRGLYLTSTSTVATGSGTNSLFEINRSGANANSSVGTNGLKISVLNSGTSSTNHGLYIDASGGTTNYGIRAAGSTTGVYGLSLSASGIGVYGYANGAGSKGVQAVTAATSGTNYGLFAQASGAATAQYAGYFSASGATTNYGIRVEAGISSFNAAINMKYVNKTADYTADETDYAIFVDATSAAVTITLPAASGTGQPGRTYIIKKTDVSGNAVTVDGNASETIDGATTYALSAQYKYVTIQSNGTNWFIIGNN